MKNVFGRGSGQRKRLVIMVSESTHERIEKAKLEVETLGGDADFSEQFESGVVWVIEKIEGMIGKKAGGDAGKGLQTPSGVTRSAAAPASSGNMPRPPAPPKPASPNPPPPREGR